MVHKTVELADFSIFFFFLSFFFLAKVPSGSVEVEYAV